MLEHVLHILWLSLEISKAIQHSTSHTPKTTQHLIELHFGFPNTHFNPKPKGQTAWNLSTPLTLKNTKAK